MNPDESAHYEGVGRFITSFAGAEADVRLIARKLSFRGLFPAGLFPFRLFFGGYRGSITQA